VVFKTQGQRFSNAKLKLKEQLHAMMHWKVKDQTKRLNQILRGHYNYYGLPGNSRRLQTLRMFALRYWRLSLSRRSQNGKVTWEKYKVILEQHPIVQPKLHITYATITRFVLLLTFSLLSRMREIRTYGSPGGARGDAAPTPPALRGCCQASRTPPRARAIWLW